MSNLHRPLLLPAAGLLSLLACSKEQPPTLADPEPTTTGTTTTPTTTGTTAIRLAATGPDDAVGETERFFRFVDEGDGEGRLETALVAYRGPRGQRVDLVAALHVADRLYYQDLQKRFESYDALLYEMVKPSYVQPTRENTRAGGLLSFFQRKLKSVLDLEFQLDGIDYMQANFVHADLDVATFRRLSEDRGENVVALLLKAMADHQRRQRSKGSEAPPPLGLGQLLAAFLSEDSSRTFKHLLAQQLHHVERALAGLGEGSDGGSVILTERNKRCIQVLKDRLKKGDRSIGIFYGAAHMPDLEERLVTELGFEKTGERWLTAWDIRKQKTTSRPGK